MPRTDLVTNELRLGGYLKHAWANRASTEQEAEMSWKTDNETVNLNRDGATAFGRSVELLVGIEEIRNRVSQKMMEDCLWKQLVVLSRLPNTIIARSANESARKVLAKLLNYQVETCSVNFPVFGLKISPECFEINIGDVVIYNVRSVHHKTESNRWYRGRSPEEWSKELNRGLEDKSVPGGSPYWAKATIQTNRNDENRIRQEGAKLIRESLALLCLFVPAYPTQEPMRSVHLDQQPMLDISNVEPVHREGYVKEFWIDGNYKTSSTTSLKTTTFHYLISDRIMNAFHREGFLECAKVLKGRTPSQLETRIRRALDYFSSGMRTHDVFHRYVMYTAGLEALLMKENERQGVTRKLPERASWLLESDRKKRAQLLALVGGLYGLRCDVVHGESPSTVLVEQGLRYLRWILYSVVKRLVTGSEHFTSVDDVAKWVKGKT